MKRFLLSKKQSFLRSKITLQYIIIFVLIFAVTYLLPFPADIYIHMIVMLWIALNKGIVFSNVTSFILILFILVQQIIHPDELRYLFIGLSFITLLQIFVNLFIIRQNIAVHKLSETEEALKSEIKLRKIFEESLLKIRLSDIALLNTIPLAILVYSLEGDQRFYHNRAAMHLLHADDDNMPQTIDDLYCLHTSHQTEIIDSIYAFHTSNLVFMSPIEHTLSIKGTTVHVKSQIHRITYDDKDALLLMLTDISESKEAESALRENEKSYRMILEASHSAIIVFAYRNNEVLYQNPAWYRIIEGEHVHFDDMMNKILISERKEEYQTITETFRLNGFVQGETQLRTLKNREITVQFNINPIIFHGREAALLMMYDITEERNAQILKAQLEHEREIRQLRDEFVTLMSHEFRTPLAIIQTSMDICLRYSDRLTQEQVSDHYRNVLKQVNNMVDMVDDILLLSRANVDMLEFEPKQYHLGQYIKDLIAELTFLQETPRQIDFQIEGDFHDSYFDPTLIRHIITHLLDNAMRYSEEETPILVQLSRQDTDALITVTDHGIGIPADAPNIFEPFTCIINSTKPNGPGLGLAVVESSTKRHGGSISYQSSDAHTIFKVNIPIIGTNPDANTSNTHNNSRSVN